MLFKSGFITRLVVLEEEEAAEVQSKFLTNISLHYIIEPIETALSLAGVEPLFVDLWI